MVLKGYRKNIIRPLSNRNMEDLFCIARLDEDIAEVLPYLNTVMRGLQYTKEPPAVLFKVDGKIIVVRAQEIAINKVEDEADAEDTLQWLKERINETWRKRGEIEPRFEPTPRPAIIQILKLLGQTDCRECGEPSCVVFAVELADGVKEPADCPMLDEGRKARVEEYLQQFE